MAPHGPYGPRSAPLETAARGAAVAGRRLIRPPGAGTLLGMAEETSAQGGGVGIRKARMDDVEPVFALVTVYSRRQVMLPRSRADLYESLREFQVAEADGAVLGCGALAIQWADLAEVKSLAVAEAAQRRGIGTRLVRACLKEAGGLAVGRVFALTTVPAFFERLGFRPIRKESLPHKIWADCVRCPKFPDCDEEAVAIDL